MSEDSARPERDAPGGAPGGWFGVRSMVAPLRRVLVRRPAVTGDFAAAAWRLPDPDLMLRQHDAFAATLAGLGCAVEVAPALDGLVDAVYVRDPGLVTGTGAVLFHMAKPARMAEPGHLGAALEAAGVPVTARLSGRARADGGDFIWLDERTVLAGRSYRTNAEALTQLAAILAAQGVTLEQVDLPHDRGPGHVLHLMSLISPVAADLAVVYPPLAPVRLMEALADRGIKVIAVDAEEYQTMGCNVLAVAPGRVVVVDGNPRTRAALESAGCEVHGYDGSEISVKGDGGPTCLTAPIWRGDSAPARSSSEAAGGPRELLR
jgi:N-dimethylarginine dimethylaminohydrolase